MAVHKAIVTITWKFESDASYKEALAKAKNQLEKILECNPYGESYDGFSVQMDLAQMKARKKLVHLGEFEPSEVFPYVTHGDEKREYTVGNKTYQVRMNSDRYFVFQKSRKCMSCGIEGKKMMLDMNPGDCSPHFNLYAEENGRLILMTKDHILAKSRGGQDKLENYQVCCSTCNNLKGAYDITYEQVRDLRVIYNNESKIPKKELRDLINKTREEMAQKNVG